MGDGRRPRSPGPSPLNHEPWPLTINNRIINELFDHLLQASSIIQSFKVQKNKVSEFQSFKIRRFRDSDIPRFQESKTPRLQDFKISRFQNFKLQSFKVSKFRKFKVENFQMSNLQIFKFHKNTVYHDGACSSLFAF